LIGVLLWILGIMSAGAPLLFAVVILLLDLTMTYEVRQNERKQKYKMAAKLLIFHYFL
jgi:CHASE1-domain containing sensor protein